MKIAVSFTEVLILIGVSLNCYVNVAKYISDQRKNKDCSEQDA